MELWVRSQDKKILEKCEDLFSAYYSSKKSYAICSHKNMVTLGLYKSEERALEVLDEIQSQLINKYYLTPKEELTLEEQDQLMNIGRNPKIDLVFTLDKMELKPLNNNVYIYEMPDE